jgi:tRNA(fMet)-specific endonuclease VapC
VNGIGAISKEVLDIASSIYNDLRKGGTVIETTDILIAAWCIENRCILVTNNKKHFTNIAELSVENWLE